MLENPTTEKSLAFQTLFVDLFRAQATLLDGYFFECRPIRPSHALSQPFEFVLVATNAFSHLASDQSAFTEHFRNDEPVAVFPNVCFASLPLNADIYLLFENIYLVVW
jgi:hypothetical protein